MVSRGKTWEHGTKKGKPGRFRESSKLGNHRVRSALVKETENTFTLWLREAPSAKGPNLAQ